ncbi:aldose 1-epimerase [Streptomyces sp. ISL-86]|uniref:aldose epimerase family protein n=1 Tax=Streptomyces sp. ISL-86 TaxID=2819187 RepID=UPI001BE5D8BB|nr:aldose 1-epimerase [Streptomyces sp. ISL-86]MBT2453586.1 aldose 1-epimerase [Streptomyces sp. ISL-86]
MSTQLKAGGAELTIDQENGCRISSLRIDGTELLRQGPNFGAFPMVPWCGRTGYGQFRDAGVLHQLPVNHPPHAIHGFGRDHAWRPARVTDTDAAFTFDLADPWPWPGRVTQTVELTEDSLTLAMGVETYQDSFPAQAGWHPWFRRNLGTGGEDVRLDFEAAWQEERGEDYLPSGNRIDPKPGPWDDCFGMPGGIDVTLTWPGTLEVKITSRDEWVVIYDEQPEAVCVEPQSGPPNGLNTLPRLVTPVDPLEISTTWTWRRLA